MSTPPDIGTGTGEAGKGAHDLTAEVRELTRLVMRLAADTAPLKNRLAHVEDRQEVLAVAIDDVEQLLDIEIPLPDGPGRYPDDTTSEQTPPADDHEHAAGTDDEELAEEPGLDMRRLVAWVRDNVALLLERKVPQTGGAPMWCRSWWLHPEAIARFEAARRSWAEAVAEPTGNALAVYFEHLDHQLGVLCSETGPFHRCKGGERHTDPSTDSAAVLGQAEPDEWFFLDFEDRSWELQNGIRPLGEVAPRP